MRNLRTLFTLALLVLLCGAQQARAQSRSFTIAMIPDTQNYVDYTLQTSEGFAIDSVGLFMAQMQHVASKTRSNGGDIDFVASVGDVWQHVMRNSDPAHSRRGLVSNVDHPAVARFISPEGTVNFEIPRAVEGYKLIAESGVPFGVAPGNHDYDAWWAMKLEAPASPAGEQPATQIHIGGLDNFRRIFGSDSDFFRGKSWYLGGFDGGTSSAQLFAAGGYQFLHLAFEMQAGDAVLAWAQQMLDAHPGIPTIISTHDYLSPRGERKPSGGMDLASVDPGFNNSAEQIWQKFISKNDQILMVLSGHQPGQALRIDLNGSGHEVYQMLADYQDRGQAGLDAGQPRSAVGGITGIGDGWYRELTFHLGDPNPRLQVRTYSTHYRVYSGELDSYADWYRAQEQPDMTAAEFLQAEDFMLSLDDFYERFGMPAP